MPRRSATPSALKERLAAALLAGSTEHYEDPILYDHEYGRRRDDVRHYRTLASERARAGGPVLELGCGTGRLLIPLVRDGHRVTGIDLSEPMLNRCRERIARLPIDERGRATLIRGDFRAFALSRRFPLVICPFNAFQHLYERTDVERCLQAVRAHLHEDGVFALDVLNPDLHWLDRDPTRRWDRTRFRHPVTGRRMIYSTRLIYDAALQIAFHHIYYEAADDPKGRTRMVRLAHRQFFPLELEALLHYNGFEVERLDGDFAGSALLPESEQLVCRCRLRARRAEGPSRKPSAATSSRRKKRATRRKRIDNTVEV